MLSHLILTTLSQSKVARSSEARSSAWPSHSSFLMSPKLILKWDRSRHTFHQAMTNASLSLKTCLIKSNNSETQAPPLMDLAIARLAPASILDLRMRVLMFRMEPKFKMHFKSNPMETPSSTLWDSLWMRPTLSSRQPLLMFISLEQKCAKISNSMAIANMETR